MSGHSKWHNIRLRKGRQDAERGKLFTRLAREIIMAAREGGGNPEANNRLRIAIEKAREHSMPQENIRRAIQRGTGELPGAAYEEVTYEGYGPGGVAVLVEASTDNRNRTVAELRTIFSKCGGKLGETGSVAWLFDSRSLITVPKDAASEEDVLAVALDAGAEDVQSEESTWNVIGPPEALADLRAALDRAGIPVQSAEVTRLPRTTVHLDGKEAQQMLRLMEQLEDHDDVQNVYANFDIEESVIVAYT